MIRSFRSKALRQFTETGETRRLSVPDEKRLRRLLNQLEAATTPEDMNLPGNRFHRLKGDRRDTFAVNASGNYRLTFGWDGHDVVDVDLEDYH